MSKELTPLEELQKIKDVFNEFQYGFITKEDYESLNIIEKSLKDFEWLKSKISIDWFDKLPTDDKFRVMKIMGVEYGEEN